jgi:hypothetical protein
MKNPTAVIAAFAPQVPRELTLQAVLLLEAVGCRYLTGGVPGIRDAILCWLAITDFQGLAAARAKGEVDALVQDWSAGRRPAEIIALQPAITATIQAAFAPADTGAGDDGDDDDPLARLQKKATAAADGGSA